MGPPIFIGGNSGIETIQIMPTLLQWGHRFSSVEMATASVEIHASYDGFNGATDFHRWKLQNSPAA